MFGFRKKKVMAPDVCEGVRLIIESINKNTDEWKLEPFGPDYDMAWVKHRNNSAEDNFMTMEQKFTSEIKKHLNGCIQPS